MKNVNSIDNYNKQFPTTLRKLIERKNTTIKAVADFIGVSRQAVSQYQDGSTQPNAETIVKIAEFFNVTTDYLLTGKNRNIDESMNISCDFTGLSRNAVDTLRKFNTIKCKTISQIIESAEFLDIVNIIISAQYNKNLLNPSGDVIAHIIIDKLCGENKTEIEKIIDQIAEQVAQSGLAPFYKQRVIEDITTIFNKLTESGEI